MKVAIAAMDQGELTFLRAQDDRGHELHRKKLTHLMLIQHLVNLEPCIWLATEPMDMRAGTETALARVIAVFGAAKPHCAYLFANRRGRRLYRPK